MTLRIRLWPVILLLLFGGVGYLIYFLIERHKMLNLLLPEVTEITLVKATIRQDTAFVEVNMILTNRAPYKMNIDSLVCDLSLGGTKLLAISQYVGLSQESGQSDSVTFAVDIPISHTRNKILSLQDQDSTGITIEAAVVYSGLKVPFMTSKKIEVPVPPKIRLLKTENLEVKLFKKKVTADLFLQIINEGKNLALDLRGIQYELEIGDDLDTKGKLQDISIKKQSSQILKLPLDLHLLHPGKTIGKVLNHKDRLPFRVKISGFLDFGKLKHIPVVIFASGRMELVNEEKNKAKKKQKREERKEKRQEKREDRKEMREEKREERKEKREEKDK
ncbi:MAG: hypothetical protein ACO1N0_01345 [Fluviicola sp.]